MSDPQGAYELEHRFRSEAGSWKVRWTTVSDLRSGAQASAKKVRDPAGNVAFVKILNRQADPERRARVYREIVSIQRLDAAGVPKLIETNAHHYEDLDFDLFIAMQFIDGTPVSDLVPKNRITPEAAVRITLDLNAALIGATNVLHALVSAFSGSVVRAQTGFNVTSERARTQDGFQLSTNPNRRFIATFDAIPVGNEIVLRIKGPGVPRIMLRAQFLEQFDSESVERIREFLLRGLELITREDGGAQSADEKRILDDFGSNVAERMVSAMTTSVMAYVDGEGSEHMVIETPAGPIKARVSTTAATAQSMILTRLKAFNRYVRFNCLATVDVPNHADETVTEAGQEIVITITEGRTGSGLSESIRSSPYTFDPLQPSQRRFAEIVNKLLAEIPPPVREEETAESTYDAMIRSSRREQDDRTVRSPEQHEFLGKALEAVAERIREEVSDGMRRALGEPEVRAIAGEGSLRHFLVRAESTEQRARATITARLTGEGPEFERLEGARYQLELEIYARPRPGGVTGNVQPIKTKADYYGPGRPGISAPDVQTAIIRELQRVKRFGK